MLVLFISDQNTENANAQRINDRENEKKGITMKQREFFLLSFKLDFLYLCKKKESERGTKETKKVFSTQ